MKLAPMYWRGFLCFALVVAAFALIAPPHAHVEYPGVNHERTGNTQNAVQPIAFGPQAVEPAHYKQPCQGTAADRQSDLCAQWKSADWTKISSIVAMFGIAALLYQIYLTIKAVEDTGKATRAMERQNEIAEDTAKRQLRAYVGVGEIAVLQPFEVGKIFKVLFDITNTGETPAHNMVGVYLVAGARRGEMPNFDGLEADTPPSVSTLGKGAVTKVPIETGAATTQAVYDAVEAGAAIIYFGGTINYLDVFGDAHTTKFRVEFEFATKEFSFCSEGNEAT